MKDLSVEDVREQLEKKRGEVAEELEDLERKKQMALFAGLLGAVMVSALAVGSLSPERKASPVNNTSDGPELTKYQRIYVDCPQKYLELCTNMSRLMTVKVDFWKVEEGRLYLHAEKNRTIIASIEKQKMLYFN